MSLYHFPNSFYKSVYQMTTHVGLLICPYICFICLHYKPYCYTTDTCTRISWKTSLHTHSQRKYGLSQHNGCSYVEITTHLWPISFNIIQYHSISFNIIQYHSISFTIIQYHSISFNIIQYHSISFNIIQYHSI